VILILSPGIIPSFQVWFLIPKTNPEITGLTQLTSTTATVDVISLNANTFKANVHVHTYYQYLCRKLLISGKRVNILNRNEMRADNL
jgi:hypothetical protein